MPRVDEVRVPKVVQDRQALPGKPVTGRDPAQGVAGLDEVTPSRHARLTGPGAHRHDAGRLRGMDLRYRQTGLALRRGHLALRLRTGPHTLGMGVMWALPGFAH